MKRQKMRAPKPDNTSSRPVLPRNMFMNPTPIKIIRVIINLLIEMSLLTRERSNAYAI